MGVNLMGIRYIVIYLSVGELVFANIDDGYIMFGYGPFVHDEEHLQLIKFQCNIYGLLFIFHPRSKYYVNTSFV